MAETTCQIRYRTGSGEVIEEAHSFIYEINEYAFYRNEVRIEMLSSHFIQSKEELPFKKRVKRKLTPEYVSYTYITMIGAPKEYIDRLPEYNPITKVKNERKSKLQRRKNY